MPRRPARLRAAAVALPLLLLPAAAQATSWDQVKSDIKGAAHATGHAIVEAAHAAGHAIRRGAHDLGSGIHHAVHGD